MQLSEYVNLESNNLVGTIPLEIVAAPSALRKFVYCDCRAFIIKGVSQASSSSSSLSCGCAPTTEFLILARNQLVGSIPTEIGDSAALKEVDLSFNQMVGTLPTVIGSLLHLGTFLCRCPSAQTRLLTFPFRKTLDRSERHYVCHSNRNGAPVSARCVPKGKRKNAPVLLVQYLTHALQRL